MNKAFQTGPYVVGTRIISCVDESRDELLGPKSGKRVVTARLYFPIEEETSEQPFDVTAKVMGEMYLAEKPMEGKKLPMVFFNHALNSFMESNNLLCCELASHGYFVASVGHAYDAAMVTMEDGTEIKIDKKALPSIMRPTLKNLFEVLYGRIAKKSTDLFWETFDKHREEYEPFLTGRIFEWSEDVMAIYAEVKNRFGEYVDSQRGIGVLGHSFGGNVAFNMCQKYSEVKCAISLDGGLFQKMADLSVDKPFLQIKGLGNVCNKEINELRKQRNVEYEEFPEVYHLGFTDLIFFGGHRFFTGKKTAKEVSERLSKLCLDFMDRNL